jgi:hypothetical protein
MATKIYAPKHKPLTKKQRERLEALPPGPSISSARILANEIGVPIGTPICNGKAYR